MHLFWSFQLNQKIFTTSTTAHMTTRVNKGDLIKVKEQEEEEDLKKY